MTDRLAAIKAQHAIGPPETCSHWDGCDLYHWSCGVGVVLRALAQAKRERDEAQAALARLQGYAQHHPGCASMPCSGHYDGTVCTDECAIGNEPCTSGLDAPAQEPTR